MLVTAFNPDTTELEKTYLSSFIYSGVSTIPVKNNEGFTNGRKVLLGYMGAENAEVLTLSSVNTNNLSLGTSAATEFDHASDEPIYELAFDKFKIYRATTESGTYILQTTIDIDVDNVDKITRWDDPTGLDTHFYKISPYDSIDDIEGPMSDPNHTAAFTRERAGVIIDKVVRRVRDVGYTVLGPDEYLDTMNEVNDDLETQAQRPYVFLKRSFALATVAGQNYIDVRAQISDFWKYNYVEVDQYTSGANTNYKEYRPLSLEQWNQRYKNTSLSESDTIIDVAYDDETDRLYIYPTPKTTRSAKVIVHYYKHFTPFTDAGDAIETPTPLVYRYKMMAEHYSAKAENDKQFITLATKYENKYGNEIVKMQRGNRKDVGTPLSFRPPRLVRRRRYHL